MLSLIQWQQAILSLTGAARLGEIWTVTLDGTPFSSLDLGDIADGYLFVQPREDWTPAQLIEDFLGPTTIEVAERSYRALDPRTTPYTLDELEAVRMEGRSSLADEWPAVPAGPEEVEPTSKRRFGRSR